METVSEAIAAYEEFAFRKAEIRARLEEIAVAKAKVRKDIAIFQLQLATVEEEETQEKQELARLGG